MGRQGGVIYREDENLSRKFVPINIPVPGSRSPRRGGGRADPAAASTAEARGGGAAPRSPHHGGGRNRSEAQRAGARRFARSGARWDPEDPEAQTKPRAGTREGCGRGTGGIGASGRGVGQPGARTWAAPLPPKESWSGKLEPAALERSGPWS